MEPAPSAAAKLGMKVSLLNNLAALLFILPYFIFGIGGANL